MNVSCNLLHIAEDKKYYGCNKNTKSILNNTTLTENLVTCQSLFEHRHFDIYECQFASELELLSERNNTFSELNNTFYNNTTLLNNDSDGSLFLTSPNQSASELSKGNKINQTRNESNKSTIGHVQLYEDTNVTLNNASDERKISNVTNTTFVKINASEGNKITTIDDNVLIETDQVKFFFDLASIIICSLLFIALCYCFIDHKCDRYKEKRKKRRSSRSISPETVVIDIDNASEHKTKKIVTIKEKPPRPPRPPKNAPTDEVIEKVINDVMTKIIQKVELNVLREEKIKLRTLRVLKKKEVPNASLAKLTLFNVINKKKNQKNRSKQRRPRAEQNKGIKLTHKSARETALNIVRHNIEQRRPRAEQNKEMKLTHAPAKKGMTIKEITKIV